MNRNLSLRFATLAVLLCATTAFGQSFRMRSGVDLSKFKTVMPATSSEGVPGSAESRTNPIYTSLPVSVSIPGAHATPLTGKYHAQTNVGGLHNIQVDPDNKNNVHLVVMTLLDNSAADTVGSKFTSRRLLYTFSSDGGTTWGSPVTLGDTRTGYPDMILIKRNGKFVPVIAGHRLVAADGAELESAIWMETGNPGQGTFQMTSLGRVAKNGSEKDIIWPHIAASPDFSKI